MNQLSNDYLAIKDYKEDQQFSQKEPSGCDISKRIEFAQHLQGSGKFNEAINEYLIGLTNEPTSIFILIQLASLSHDIGDFSQSLNYCDKAIDLGCESHIVWYVKGAVHLKFNEIEKALNCLHKALKLSPNFYPARVDITFALLKSVKEPKEFHKVSESSYLGFNVFLNNNQYKDIIDGKIQIPIFRLKHDLEQAKYLEKINLGTANSKILIKQVSGVLGSKSRMTDSLVRLSIKEYANLISFYKESPILNVRNFNHYLNPSLDWEKIEDDYLRRKKELIYIDEFLSADVLEWLIQFSLTSKVWLNEYSLCYLGGFAENGFISEVHLNIANELRIKLPNIIKDLDLEQVWGFKYDSHLGQGLNVHADFAKINLNFWITPDEYNLDSSSGGMKVYSHPAPSDCHPTLYNSNNTDWIFNYLKCNNSDVVTIPYKQNRAVLFNSALFHETDKINFKDEYQGRRVNITYLFGKQLINERLV